LANAALVLAICISEEKRFCNARATEAEKHTLGDSLRSAVSGAAYKAERPLRYHGRTMK